MVIFHFVKNIDLTWSYDNLGEVLKCAFQVNNRVRDDNLDNSNHHGQSSSEIIEAGGRYELGQLVSIRSVRTILLSNYCTNSSFSLRLLLVQPFDVNQFYQSRPLEFTEGKNIRRMSVLKLINSCSASMVQSKKFLLEKKAYILLCLCHGVEHVIL